VSGRARALAGMATLALSVAVGACGGDGGAGPDSPRSGEPPDAAASADARRGVDETVDGGRGVDAEAAADAGPRDGRALYAAQCASCHGDVGQGGAGPALTRPYVREYLADYIDAEMPLGRPELCDRACAEAIADYILADLRAAAPTECGPEGAAGPRALRLLNRREWVVSVRALFAESAATPQAACDALSACDWLRSSCAGGVCADDPCPVKTFAFDPGDRALRSVHIAGTFNGWAPTVAAGGWPLRVDESVGRFIGKFEVPDGEHQYKLVLDEREWVADPSNPRRVSDGFSGENSVLSQACAGQPQAGGLALPELAALARDLPAETRPRGYAYDTHASATLVTPSHIEAWLAAGHAVARVVEARAAAVAPCVGAPDCARDFVPRWLDRTFRAPPSAEAVTRYVTLYEDVAADEGAPAAVAAVVEASLMSPHFLYRSELGEPAGAGAWQLTGDELADAMAFALWGAPPDDALRAAGRAGRLDTPEGRRVEAERLLSDRRAETALRAFAEQWLGVAGVSQLEKRADLYPAWSPALAEAALEETRRFVTHVALAPEARFDDLLTADYAFVNGPLRALYRLPGDPTSPDFERVTWPQGQRAGLLRHASVLASTAHSDQTSPIRRGLFVRERLLCTEFGAPPPDAGGVPDVDPTATTRERFQQHTAEARCAACHQYIDDVGFGFESYDSVGASRSMEGGRPIDDVGNMNDVEGLGTGTSAPFSSLSELGFILAESERAEVCFATQAWRFVRGRMEAHGGAAGALDTCELERVLAPFRAGGGDVRALLVALVADPAFARRADLGGAP